MNIINVNLIFYVWSFCIDVGLTSKSPTTSWRIRCLLEHQSIKFYGDKGTIVSNRMSEAFIYPENDAKSQWNEDIDAVSGASIKIIDKDKGRTIKLPKDALKDNIFEDNYEQTTWLLYKNFAAAIKGEEGLVMGLKDGYQSAISVHMANRALREERVERWLPEYDV